MDSDDTKVTIRAGDGPPVETTVGRMKKLAVPTIKRVEDLLEIHNDEQTTKALNKKWKELRNTVDNRASQDEKTVKGELKITIKYETDSDTGQHEIEVLCDIKLPKERTNKRKLYEDADGNLTPVKPTKQTELAFDNVTPIRKGV